MSFDNIDYNGLQKINCLNPFGTGQCLSTHTGNWIAFGRKCLNPFGTGQCLSTEPKEIAINSTSVSIPLEQGSVFRPNEISTHPNLISLNPFGTGQCLSTVGINSCSIRSNVVSIPLEQGSVFRHSRS